MDIECRMGWHFSSNHFCVIPKALSRNILLLTVQPLREYSRAQVTVSESSDIWLPFLPSPLWAKLYSFSVGLTYRMNAQLSWNAYWILSIHETYWEILTSYEVWPLCSFSIFIKEKSWWELLIHWCLICIFCISKKRRQ